MDENNKKNEIEKKDDMTKEENNLYELIKFGNFREINNILNPEHPEKKIWEYKTKEKDDSTILHFAILQNNTKIITKIINYSKHFLSPEDLTIFINKKNKSGITSIHLASYKGNIKIIDLLISNGGIVNMQTEKLLNVIHYSCQGNKPNCLLYYDLKYNFDFDAPDKNKTTPLHWACFASAYECVNFLLQRKNVNINSKDIDGNTPLHLAISSGVSKTVRLLLQKGALIDIKNYEGLTPMQMALKEKRVEIYNIIKSNKKLVICNLKAPAKQIQKSKKYAIIIIVFKFINYYIVIFHIFPFLFLYFEGKYFNTFFLFVYIILNITLIILFLYLILSNPGYIKNYEKINDLENLLFEKKEAFLDFCFKCSIFKTDTIKHCVICEKCCKGFDHHCLWLDNCIGKNNYTFFIMILYNSFLDILITIIIAITTTILFYKNLDKENLENIESVDSFYSHLKFGFNKLEISSEYIHIISIILLCFNALILIPLIYLIKLHFKICKGNESQINPYLLRPDANSISIPSSRDDDEISFV